MPIYGFYDEACNLEKREPKEFKIDKFSYISNPANALEKIKKLKEEDEKAINEE